MKTNTNFIGRYTVADLFEKMFAMIRRTWKTSLVGGATIVILPSILLGWAAVAMMRRMAEAVGSFGADAGAEIILPILRGIAPLPLAGLIAGIAYLFARLIVMDAVRAEAFDGSHSLAESTRRVLSVAFLPAIGQAILKSVIFGLIIGVPVAALALTMTVFASAGTTVAITVALYLAAIAVTVWLAVSLFFAPHAIVFDGKGVVSGLRHSFQTLRGFWWRVFGLLVLIQIVVSFVLGLFSTPILGVSLIPLIGRFIDAGSSGTLTDARAMEMLAGFSGIGLATMLTAFVQQVLTLMVLPVFSSLVWIDAEARANLQSGDQQ